MIGKLRLLFWLGIIMLLLSFIGIPDTWKMILAVIIGIVLITLALLLRKDCRSLRMIIRNLEQTVTEQALHTPQKEPLHHE